MAGRPEHLTEWIPSHEFVGTDEEYADACDEYETEPVIWMAANGDLTEAELERIAEKAEEARPRIGTDAEHIGSGGVDRADRRAVKLHETVVRVLRGG
ncbi:MAG: hypothetical protein WBQ41_09740 [Solirubrobacterales bacterium]